MINVIHGKNINASYSRLKSQVNLTPAGQRTKLSAQNTLDDLYQAVLTESLIEDKKLIVCENFLTSKKIKPDDKILNSIPQSKTVIFWESDSLSADILRKLPITASVELFKPEPKSFWFLDSVSPKSKMSLSYLDSLDQKEKSYGLLPGLASRILLLILAKTNIDLKTLSAISGYNLQPWQFAKIKSQSAKFAEDNLKAFFNGILKADLMIKSGSTALSEDILVSLLLVKYLKL